MRRISTLFTGSKLATAAAAAALSVVTTATLVAGGIVVSRVVDSVQGEPLGALPAIGSAQGPIVVGETDVPRSDAPGTRASTPAVTAAAPAAAEQDVPTRVVSLIDDPERVSGGVKTALDPQETGRMEEVSTIDRIGSIIKGSQDDDDSPDEGEEPPPEATEPEPEDPEDPNKVNDDGPLQQLEEASETVTSELVTDEPVL